MAATNLSFCYFLEQEYTQVALCLFSVGTCFSRPVLQAEKYADLAYTNDRYNAKALVNKGNCLLVKGDFEMAKQFYLEAIGVEADCVEAIYNLGLVEIRHMNCLNDDNVTILLLLKVNLKMGCYQEAQQAYEKLHTIVPHNPEVERFHFCAMVVC
jgi:intraflagellar transport protein 88